MLQNAPAPARSTISRVRAASERVQRLPSQKISDLAAPSLEQRKLRSQARPIIVRGCWPALRTRRSAHRSKVGVAAASLPEGGASLGSFRSRRSRHGENARDGRPEGRGTLEAVERDIPVPGPEEMRIRVQACGVCHSDSVTVEAAFPRHPVSAHSRPRGDRHQSTRLGTDVHGLERRRARRRRLVRRLLRLLPPLPAGQRPSPARMCMRSTGVTRDGGYATHMIAHVSAVAHVPDDLDAVQSAPLLCAGVTTFNALRHTGAGPATSSPSMASAASAISASSSPRGRAFAPSPSIAAATRRSSRASSGRATISTARPKTPPRR